MTPPGRVNDIRVSPHFSLREFQCRCCGAVMLSALLLEKLEALRTALGRPVVLTSGYRCRAHNSRVGGAPSSLHMRGMAADIAADAAWQERVEAAAGGLGFKELIRGGAKNYIHLAVDR